MVDTATPAVNAMEMAGNVAMHDLSLMGLFMQADIVVKAVMIGLLLCSIFCWAIIIEKWFSLKAAAFSMERFQSRFWSSEDLDEFFEQLKRRRENPLQRVFLSGMQEWYSSGAKEAPPRDSERKQSLLERVSLIMGVTRNKELDGLERYLGFLATMGSTAPFIGLFGTVWGIMNSFTSIAAEKSANLAVVAPGIAEALFATAIGLFVAIPAVIAYNRLSSEVNRLGGKMEDFCTEFGALLSRQLDKP